MTYMVPETLETLLQQGMSSDELFLESPDLFDFVEETDK